MDEEQMMMEGMEMEGDMAMEDDKMMEEEKESEDEVRKALADGGFMICCCLC